MAKTNGTISTLQIVNLIDSSRKETVAQAESIRKEMGGRLDDLGKSLEKIDSRVSNIEGRLLVYAAGLSIAFSAFFVIISRLILK